MIYLFEDKEGRKAKYIQGTIDDSVLKSAIMNCSKDELEAYIDDNFKDADAVLFHVSYVFPKAGLTNDLVKDTFIKRGVPFVYFSGGSQCSISRNNDIMTADVRSEEMYRNLSDFVNEYKNNASINLPLLVYGKGYLMNSLLKIMELVNAALWKYDRTQSIGTMELMRIKSIITSRMQESELQLEKESLLNFIDSQRVLGTLTPDSIISELQTIIDKY